MIILGLNPSHHGSVTILKNGRIKLFLQEERLSRYKYDTMPFLGLRNILKKYIVDHITWGTPSMFYPVNQRYCKSKFTTPYFMGYIDKFSNSTHNNFIYTDFSPDNHHLCHASHAFYNSGFDNAISIVIDGMGSFVDKYQQFREVESVYVFSYPFNVRLIHKNSLKLDKDEPKNFGISRAYEIINIHLGFDRNEAGKTMGLSSYGKDNPNLPEIYNNINLFTTQNLSKRQIKAIKNNQLDSDDMYVDEKINPILKPHTKLNKWHRDESKIRNIEKDLAWKIQKDSQEKVAELVKKAINKSGLKKICCSGGYFLNCVTNYYLLKQFPDIEFYFEPIANDAGTAIGAAKITHHSITKDTTIRPLKSLYLGPKYSKKQLLKKIKKYVDK